MSFGKVAWLPYLFQHISHQDEDVLKVLEPSLTTSVWPPGLPHSGMRELTPQGCPVTSIGKLWSVFAHTDSHSDS